MLVVQSEIVLLRKKVLVRVSVHLVVFKVR